jgi:hypothetical protein
MKQSVLTFVTRIMSIKSKFTLSNKCYKESIKSKFTFSNKCHKELLSLFSNVLPRNHKMP